MKKCLPDYRHGGLVNLMSSLVRGMGMNTTAYEPSELLSPDTVAQYDNVIFILIDGLGSHNLQQHGPQSSISKHRVGDLTSVFPSTTSAAITTLNTALAPQQHGATGWFMYLQELASVAAVLPFVPRVGGASYTESGVEVEQIISSKPFYGDLDRPSFAVTPNYILDSAYSQAMTRGAKRYGYGKLEAFYQSIVDRVQQQDGKKYIYAYWSEYDGMCHSYGVADKKTKEHFKEIDRGFSGLLKSLEGSHSLVVLTADHGLIDTTPERIIYIEDYPEVSECLRIPICGEPRACFCYVKPDKFDEFPQRVEKFLGEYCEVHTAAQLIEDEYFGLGEPHEQLASRVGDFILLLKENYVLKDRLINEKPFRQVGVHGGVSEQEMQIPLVLATP